jgi:hypothetical protein
MQELRIVILRLGTAELLLRRCPLYGDAGVPMLEVCVTALTLYSDAKVANRDIRVRHGGAAAAPLSVVRRRRRAHARLRDSVRPLRPCGFQPSVASPPYRFREGRRISSRTQQRHASREPTWRVPSRAVGKLFVVPARALPVPVSEKL